MSALCRFCGANDPGRKSCRGSNRPSAILVVSLWLLSALSLLAVPPGIATQPLARTVVEGASYSFSVVANGTAPFSYQWRRYSIDLPSQTNSSLALTTIQTND